MVTDHKKALISGASFAGLSTAYWLNRLGYRVTIVEIAPALKKGGTPVNILGKTIDITRNMGLFDQIYANRLRMEKMEMKNAAGFTELTDYHGQREQEEYEVERDYLLKLLHGLIRENVEIIYAETVTGLRDTGSDVEVTFKNSPPRSFDLVFGCDGIHSVVRRLWFGEEKEFSHFLQAYFSISIVDKLLIAENTTQLYSEVGKTVMLNAYNGKTDICFAYFSEDEVPYDYRNEHQMRSMIDEQFRDSGWRSRELLQEIKRSESFYFDKLCQIKMPSWTSGRVALVGDAGYCPSPAAGRGGSLAIDGAAALADSFIKYGGNFELAFLDYNSTLRPFIEQVQSEVTDFGLDVLIPKTLEAIQKRNSKGFGF